MGVLILRHTPGNTLGVLEPLLRDFGLAARYVEAPALEAGALPGLLAERAGLIILGGRESVTEEARYPFMAVEQQLIRETLARGLPIFGICLGAQMLARAMGAQVKRNTVKETGWVPLILSPEGQLDPVLSVLKGVGQFQWHEDTFDCPPGAVPLASSATCPQQAYRLSPKVYGVQFHPEVDHATIAAWLDQSRNTPAHRKAEIRAETGALFEHASRLSREMFTRYLRQAY